ncbi:hypothetical protein GCM10023194_58540 [Planotetraspora phitsanulokensis]|uniref:Uncharacterized protein n=1 Tax=Planotetraspora phitsanulokensis TaxID=575192 RepID=A0A8J3U8L2_9ACTN|nr:hypothetical protein [Planotetraspora phitsanulokensis]GII40315.1 hypothetical protein Pph01_53180 [Planotetraspora phitsanulokensis]
MINEPPENDRTTAEQLIRAAAADVGSDAAPLAELLAAATAPARPDETAGLHAALTAFRQARRTGTIPSHRRGIMTRILSIKAATIALAIALLGGVATATGPSPMPPAEQPTAPQSHAGSGTPSFMPSGDARTRQSSLSPTASPSPSSRSAPVEPCTTHSATKPTDKPDLSPPGKASRGKRKVHGHCADPAPHGKISHRKATPPARKSERDHRPPRHDK